MILFSRKIRSLLFLAAGTILCFGGICGLFHHEPVRFSGQTEEGLSLEGQLDALPDHDYVRDIQILMEQEKFGEAKVLCEDLIRQELPDAEKAKEYEKICEDELDSIGRRIGRMSYSFVTGDPGSSVEEAGAAFAADMTMYGDVRDLVQQGYFKYTGQETDVFIVAIASAGLLTEFVDAVDWVPALMKALYRTKALTKTMCKVIVASINKSRQAGKILPETKKLFGHFAKLYKKTGFLRTKDIIHTAGNAADLEKVAALAEKSPELTHLLSRTAKGNSVKVIDKLDAVKKKRSSQKSRHEGAGGNNACPAVCEKHPEKERAGLVRPGMGQDFVDKIRTVSACRNAGCRCLLHHLRYFRFMQEEKAERLIKEKSSVPLEQQK